MFRKRDALKCFRERDPSFAIGRPYNVGQKEYETSTNIHRRCRHTHGCVSWQCLSLHERWVPISPRLHRFRSSLRWHSARCATRHDLVLVGFCRRCSRIARPGEFHPIESRIMDLLLPILRPRFLPDHCSVALDQSQTKCKERCPTNSLRRFLNPRRRGSRNASGVTFGPIDAGSKYEPL